MTFTAQRVAWRGVALSLSQCHTVGTRVSLENIIMYPVTCVASIAD